VDSRLRRLFVVSALVVAGLPGCGGGDDGSRTPGRAPAPSPAPAPQNPCDTAATDTAVDDGLAASGHAARKRAGPRLDHDPRGNVYQSLWIHQAARRAGPLAAAPDAAASEDVGEVAVLQDEGDLLVQPNRFDLRNVGLRFVRSGAGYDITRIPASFRPSIGSRVRLDDDDTEEFPLAFAFPFYGRDQGRAFVNSDGNVTFEEGDDASTERNVSRLLTGAPRVAPFFADLDPTMGAGRLYVQSAADAFTVTWCVVRGFDSAQSVTVQATLLPSGDVEMQFGDRIDLPDAIVGLSPGRSGRFATLDLSAAGTLGGGDAAVGERFAESIDLDLVAVSRRFYQAHPDGYDQLVIWTDIGVTQEAFAFETTVANEIRGLGTDVFDQSRAFGSAGRLRSIVMMDALGKYPSDPQARVLGENSVVAILGHETGHHWLAFLRFRDKDGRESEALLGRDQAHWSFFMDSDASLLEGNDIEDLGGGRFRTTGAVSRYSLLDQYAMGLISESQVPPFFYVEDPANVTPDRTPSANPETGITFAGTRRVVLMQDVIDVMGPREPSFRDSPRLHRQAYIYVISPNRSIDRSQVDKIDLIRRQFEPFFNRAADGRARVETRLRPPT
jgi:hypothetical protein